MRIAKLLCCGMDRVSFDNPVDSPGERSGRAGNSMAAPRHLDRSVRVACGIRSDRSDLYFVRSSPKFEGWRIYVSHCVAAGWSKPESPSFAGDGVEADPFITPDGRAHS
jgi:hypothetical protein